MSINIDNNLFEAAKLILLEPCQSLKLERSYATAREWMSHKLFINPTDQIDAITPTYPKSLKLVMPRELAKRKMNGQQGLLSMVHAIAHIEFNAIHLAWDAVYRFQNMPRSFYCDWVKVALEETQHFEMLQNHLKSMGSEYGAFPAHQGLWEMAEATAGSVIERMALVPRVLEARGLDVTPSIQKKFKKAGDNRMVEILSTIMEEEVGHVAIGNRWYRYVCQQYDCCPAETFIECVNKHLTGQLRGPFLEQARVDAGFSQSELKMLDELSEQLSEKMSNK